MKYRKLFGVLALIGAVAVPVWAQQAVSEEDYDLAMKAIRATQQGVNGHLEAQNAAEVGADGAKLVEAFETVEAFWRGRNEEAALELSTKALQASRQFQEAGGAGNFDAATAAFGEIRSTCMPCHQQYRERVEGGGFRIKQGS
jgi:cytochrome c556